MGWIYHERQSAALCGQHCLNNLLQGFHFSVDSLAEIAAEVDERERKVMQSEGFGSACGSGSQNVDQAGNFSIQVLREALSRVGLSLTSLMAESLRASDMDVTTRSGFVLHKDNHWFTVRSVNGNFWNLDSVKPRPLRISHFDLAREMGEFLNAGYIAFTCLDSQGFPAKLPDPPSEDWQVDSVRNEFLWSEKDLITGTENDRSSLSTWSKAGQGMRLDGGGGSSATAIDVDEMSEDQQMQAAISASMQAANGGGSSSIPHPSNLTDLSEMSEEQQIEAAIAASMASSRSSNSQPPAGEDDGAQRVQVQIRLPSGRRVVQEFNPSSNLHALVEYVYREEGEGGVAAGGGGGRRRMQLRKGYPSVTMRDLSSSIGDADLEGMAISARWV